MKIRQIESGIALDVAGYGIPLSPKEAGDLALAIAHRALSRASTPSPTTRLHFAGTGNGFVAKMPVESVDGFDVVVRIDAKPKAWLAISVRLYAIASGNLHATLDDVLASEFGS